MRSRSEERGARMYRLEWGYTYPVLHHVKDAPVDPVIGIFPSAKSPCPPPALHPAHRLCTRAWPPASRLSLRHSFDTERCLDAGNKQWNNSLITFFEPFYFHERLIFFSSQRRERKLTNKKVFEKNNYSANAPLWVLSPHLFAVGRVPASRGLIIVLHKSWTPE